MRTARLCPPGRQVYHVMSRAVYGTPRFTPPDKEEFRRLMRAYEKFCGVRVLTYAVMGTHFHILLEVPEREELTEQEVVCRLRAIYTDAQVRERLEQWAEWRREGDEARVQRELDALRGRMYDLSQYMKTLKQRYTQWYNRRHQRRGTLWEQRFKSLLVEGQPNALLCVGAYIDLNPLRAGACLDPKDYRWCGFSEAVAGDVRSQDGIRRLYASTLPDLSWEALCGTYRMMLFEKGEQGGPVTFSSERVRQILAQNGTLSRFELLRCRVRYFSDGLVLGSEAFVERIFARHRKYFSAKRRTGARRMKFAPLDGLFVARALRLDTVTPPD